MNCCGVYKALDFPCEICDPCFKILRLEGGLQCGGNMKNILNLTSMQKWVTSVYFYNSLHAK